MKEACASFWNFVDSRAIVRRVTLGVTLWMTWKSFTWATVFAASYQVGAGVDMGAVIAAVTAPIAALQGYVFKVYSDGRA